MNRGLGNLDFLTQQLLGKLLERRVGPPVIGKLMPLARNALKELGIFFRIASYHRKYRLHIMGPEGFQNHFRGAGEWRVIQDQGENARGIS